VVMASSALQSMLCSRWARALFALVLAVILMGQTPLQQAQERQRQRQRQQAAAAGEAAGPALRLEVFEELQAAQQQIDSGDFAAAIAGLQELSTREQADAFAFGIIQQYLIQALVLADRLEDARRVGESALGRDDLAPDARRQLLYLSGKLAVLVERFELAIERLAGWVATEDDPNAEGYYLLGYAHFRHGDHASAERYLREAVSGANAPDGWQELLLAVLVEQKKFGEAERLLRQRLAAAPDRLALWQSLASVRLQRGQEQGALAALMLAHRRGLLTESEALERLVRMHQYLGAPERAGRLLEGWMKEGRLRKDPHRSEWLGQLWLQARERGRAKAALALAMQQSESGRAADLLGRLEFEDENWAAAMAALDQARRQGSLDSPQQTSLLLGIAALREQSFQTARAALESAAAHADTANQARYWLSRLE